jgi:hypothetical protein
MRTRSLPVLVLALGLSVPLTGVASESGAGKVPLWKRPLALFSRKADAGKSKVKALPRGKSTTAQKLWLGAHLATTAVAASQLGDHVVHHPWLLPIAFGAAYLGYEAADPVSGVIHHELDNYHQEKKGWLGRTARYFQHHHADSAEVIIHDGKLRAFADLVQTTAPVTPFALALLDAWQTAPDASPGRLALHVGLKAAAFGLAQGALLGVAAHAYAHTNARLIPKPAQWAQKLGLFISGKIHGKHHHDPYGHGYGIQTGRANDLLDKLGLYRWKERARYRLTGAVPNSWRGDKGKEIMAAALGPDAPELVDGLPALPPEARENWE